MNHSKLLALTVLLVVVLLVFLGMGVALIVNPDWFIKRSGVRKGGELLTDLNRLEFQFVGALTIAFVVHIAYKMFQELAKAL